MSPSLGRLLRRDLAVLLATLGLWLLDTVLRGAGDGGAVVALVALAAGTATAVCGFLLHEWGHLIGALSAGAVVHPADRLASVFLFRFDADRNGRAEFLRMSLGGFAASTAAVAFLLAVLPLGALSGRVAMALVVLGVAATLVLEIPVAVRVWRGAPLPRGAAYRSSAPDASSSA